MDAPVPWKPLQNETIKPEYIHKVKIYPEAKKVRVMGGVQESDLKRRCSYPIRETWWVCDLLYFAGRSGGVRQRAAAA